MVAQSLLGRDMLMLSVRSCGMCPSSTTFKVLDVINSTKPIVMLAKVWSYKKIAVSNRKNVSFERGSIS